MARSMPHQDVIVTTTFRPARCTLHASDDPWRRGRRAACENTVVAARSRSRSHEDKAEASNDELDGEGAGYGDNVQLYTKDVAYLREKYGTLHARVCVALADRSALQTCLHEGAMTATHTPPLHSRHPRVRPPFTCRRV